MEGRKPDSPVTVQRAFAPTRLRGDLLAQAYEHVVKHVSSPTESQENQATRPARSRKRMSQVSTTGGRKS